MPKVVTDKDVLDGRQIQHAERDNDGAFHFHSKQVFDLDEIRYCDWDERCRSPSKTCVSAYYSPVPATGLTLGRMVLTLAFECWVFADYLPSSFCSR